MATDTAPRHALAARVETARLEADRSVAWLARRAGISSSPMRRKLDGEVDFAVWELARVAQALGRPISSFIPDDWEAEAALVAPSLDEIAAA